MTCRMNVYKNTELGGHTGNLSESTVGKPWTDWQGISSLKVDGDCPWLLQSRDVGGAEFLFTKDTNQHSLNVGNGLSSGLDNVDKWYGGNHVNFIKLPKPMSMTKYPFVKDIKVYGNRDWTDRFGYVVNHSASKDTSKPVKLTKNGISKVPCKGAKESHVVKHVNPKEIHHETELVYRCGYAMENEGIKSLGDDLDPTSDPRYSMWSELATKYCNSNHNDYEQLIGFGKKCKDFTKKDDLSNFCKQNNNIVTKKVCNKTNLGKEGYRDIGMAYCENNSTDEFCRCHNNVYYNTVCKQNPQAPGCAEAKAIIDGFTTQGVEPDVIQSFLNCSPTCQTANYNPILQQCQTNVNACLAQINVGSANNSSISAECNIFDKKNPDSAPSLGDLGDEDDFFDDDDKKGSLFLFIFVCLISLMCFGMFTVLLV